jgi:hypothetical protein
MSWGYGEMSNEASYDKYFTTPSGHAGITFIASSPQTSVISGLFGIILRKSSKTPHVFVIM